MNKATNDESKSVIKGGYYIAPSGPAKPLVDTSITWGTASPTLASNPESSKNQTLEIKSKPATLNDK